VSRQHQLLNQGILNHSNINYIVHRQFTTSGKDKNILEAFTKEYEFERDNYEAVTLHYRLNFIYRYLKNQIFYLITDMNSTRPVMQSA
jgi:hypothetical protein